MGGRARRWPTILSGGSDARRIQKLLQPGKARDGRVAAYQRNDVEEARADALTRHGHPGGRDGSGRQPEPLRRRFAGRPRHDRPAPCQAEAVSGFDERLTRPIGWSAIAARGRPYSSIAVSYT